MKREFRKLFVFKWIGVVCSAVVTTLWLVSQRFEIFHISAMGVIGCSSGSIFYDSSNLLNVATGGWHINSTSYWSLASCFDLPRFTWEGSPWSNGTGSGYCGIFVPFWCVVSAALFVTGFLWFADRRRLGECAGCRYDLTGNVSGVCPECGTAVDRGATNP